MGGPGLSRRTLLAGAALGCAGLAGGCGVPRGERELRYWNLFAGGDGDTMKAMLARYRAAHPDVALRDVTLEWGDRYYTKLAMAGAAERAPDLAILHLGRLPAFAPGGLIDELRPDLLREKGIEPDHFPAGLWNRSHHGGRLFAVPLDTHPVVQYHNTDVCREAGLLDEHGRFRPLRGPEAVRDALRRAKQVTGDSGLLLETTGDGVGPWRLFWSLYRQLGGDLITPDGTRSAVDDRKVATVLDFVQGLHGDGLATGGLDGDGAIALFSSGRAGFFWYGEWEVQTFLESGMPFSMTRFPAVFGRALAEADSHAFVLPHRDRSDEDHLRVYDLVAALLRDSLAWAEGGHIPAYLPVNRSRAYADMQPQSEYRSVIDDVQLDPDVWFAGSGSRLWTEMNSVLGPAMDGRLAVPRAVSQIRQVVDDLLATPNPTA
ncbi:extracellular solute-binding protein [Saccharopolyspora sp. TS4A08]|uniref:Extracellular solute-binding protein n=1 Tax=Saccharopolyspora ipomoeae TaxID=3042027 RepID=A0ABT6PWV3_9PSEU|nr:extracellular solute-binding protein [Saccharopolyspora sp. TS4A08]MDI2031841.1 extracellular solute-binding protein [Saccharopolyspora sp. TS4A08]